MKKLVLTLAAVCAVAATVVGTGLANPEAGRVVDEGFACGVLDGNGNVFITTDSVLTVYANQQGAKAVLQCEGTGAPAAFLKHYNYERTGLVCGTAFGGTTWWDNKVGRAGHAQLTCTVPLNGDDAVASSGGVAGLG